MIKTSYKTVYCSYLTIYERNESSVIENNRTNPNEKLQYDGNFKFHQEPYKQPHNCNTAKISEN